MDSTVSRTAYILQIHKNPSQVNKFINQIISEEYTDVFIHLDKKNYGELYKDILKHPRVVILKETIDVKWGDITQVDSTLLLMKEVISAGKNYDFICFRSGQDLLVKNGFKDFLLNNKNKIFMTANYIDSAASYASFANVKWPKVTRRAYESAFHPYRIFRRAVAYLYGAGLTLFPNPHKLPDQYSLYEGQQWFCIPYPVAEFIIEFLDQNTWFYDAFKDSLCPDEFFFQTLIMNSKYKSQVVNENLMFIKWGDTLKSRGRPFTLKMNHLDLIKSSGQYFARKFDENVDKPIIDYFSTTVRM